MQLNQRGFILSALLTIALGVIFFGAIYRTYLSAPSSFPAPYTLTVEEGENVSGIANRMKADNAIRSPLAFRVFMRALGSDTKISEGQYTFDQPLSSLAIALRISGKEFGIAKQKVTFPEGYTNADMARHMKKVFPQFDAEQFQVLIGGKQGYQFPDTYSFFGTPLPSVVASTIAENYEKKIAPLREEIAATGYSEKDIIIMASIIEKEAYGENDRAVIAGILWNRIKNGMRLQVDAAPDTYRTSGLPAKAIANPGLAAIKAALHPEQSPYVYYLHDKTGAIHYASTYKQHQQNINNYLK